MTAGEAACYDGHSPWRSYQRQGLGRLGCLPHSGLPLVMRPLYHTWGYRISTMVCHGKKYPVSAGDEGSLTSFTSSPRASCATYAHCFGCAGPVTSLIVKTRLPRPF
jgi:hypothetical protein